MDSDSARLKVYTCRSGNIITRNLCFLPVYEDRLAVAAVIDLKIFWLPAEQTVHLFENQVLKNNWKAKRAEIITYGDGCCTFKNPKISIGGTNIETRVMAKVELFKIHARCEIVLQYEGTQDTEPGVNLTL